MRQLLQTASVVEDVRVPTLQNLCEAVGLLREPGPVEAEQPVGRRRRNRDAAAKALIEPSAFADQGFHVPKPAVNVLGAGLWRGRGRSHRRCPPLLEALADVGECRAAAQHAADQGRLLRNDRGDCIHHAEALWVTPPDFAAAELVELARRLRRLVQVRLGIVLEAADTAVEFDRGAGRGLRTLEAAPAGGLLASSASSVRRPPLPLVVALATTLRCALTLWSSLPSY